MRDFSAVNIGQGEGGEEGEKEVPRVDLKLLTGRNCEIRRRESRGNIARRYHERSKLPRFFVSTKKRSGKKAGKEGNRTGKGKRSSLDSRRITSIESTLSLGYCFHWDTGCPTPVEVSYAPSDFPTAFPTGLPRETLQNLIDSIHETRGRR